MVETRIIHIRASPPYEPLLYVLFMRVRVFFEGEKLADLRAIRANVEVDTLSTLFMASSPGLSSKTMA